MPIYQPLTPEDITQLMGDFGQDNILEHQQLSGGSANSNYRVKTTDGSFILTVCETKTVTETQQLILALSHLELHGFHSSICYHTAMGEEMTFLGDKPVILKSYIEGEMCKKLNPLFAYQLGKHIGALHLVPPPNFLPINHEYGIETFSTLRSQASQSHPFIDWIEQMEDYIRPYITTTLPMCMIHGDIFTDNLIQTNDNQLVIMDFEESCLYHRVFDLGMTIVGTCFVNGQLEMDLARNLLKGYLSKISITPEELKALQAFSVYAAAGTALWRFKQFNLLFPDDRLKDHYREMLLMAETLKESDDLFDTLFE